MAQNPNLAALSAAGVSVWLDDLSRDRLQSGNLKELIDTRSVVGVTTNPSIFQAALSKGTAYDAQVAELAERGADVDATIRTVTTDDVRNACDVLAKVYEASGGVDGRVSIEVDPRLAHDTDKTILQAIELWKIVDRPNLLIKIPATEAGLAAITAVVGEGISVKILVEQCRVDVDEALANRLRGVVAIVLLEQVHVHTVQGDRDTGAQRCPGWNMAVVGHAVPGAQDAQHGRLRHVGGVGELRCRALLVGHK